VKGCAARGFDKSKAGFHEYVLPATAGEPICKDVSAQVRVLSIPAFATGGVMFLEITTWSIVLQPFAILVTVSV